MTDAEDKVERRRRQLREAQQRRRDKLKAEGKRAASGPGGKDTTQAERMRRYRARKAKNNVDAP